MPGAVQLASMRAWVQGTRIVPDDVFLDYRNAGQVAPLESPVKEFDKAVRVYAGVSETHNVVVALGTEPGFYLGIRDGWRITEQISDRREVKTWRVSR